MQHFYLFIIIICVWTYIIEHPDDVERWLIALRLEKGLDKLSQPSKESDKHDHSFAPTEEGNQIIIPNEDEANTLENKELAPATEYFTTIRDKEKMDNKSTFAWEVNEDAFAEEFNRKHRKKKYQTNQIKK
jgi:hypothetical protein